MVIWVCFRAFLGLFKVSSQCVFILHLKYRWLLGWKESISSIGKALKGQWWTGTVWGWGVLGIRQGLEEGGSEKKFKVNLKYWQSLKGQMWVVTVWGWALGIRQGLEMEEEAILQYWIVWGWALGRVWKEEEWRYLQYWQSQRWAGTVWGWALGIRQGLEGGGSRWYLTH